MMADITYVCLYMSYLQSLAPFTDAERGRLVMAMLNYASTGEVPQFDGNERFIWPSLQMQIDRDIETYQAKCSRNRANGSKGGRPSKNPAVIPETEWFLEEPEKPKEKKKEKGKDREKDNIGADKPPTRSKFSPPSVDEVNMYCQEKGLSIDAQRFVDYYESNGWMVGRNKMKDWRAAVRNWGRKGNTNSGKTELEQVWPDIGTTV